MRLNKNNKLKVNVFIMIMALIMQTIVPAFGHVSVAEPVDQELLNSEDEQTVDGDEEEVSTTELEYEAKGEVVITTEESGITFEDGKFIIPEGVREFEFTDDGVDKKAKLEGEAWEITSEEVDEAKDETQDQPQEEENQNKPEGSKDVEGSEVEDSGVEETDGEKNPEEETPVEVDEKPLPELDLDTSFSDMMAGLLGAEEAKDLGDIFTELVFEVDKLGDDSYVNILESSNTRIEVGNNTLVRLKYDWQLADDVELNSGDYATITIPDAFAAIAGPGLTGNLETDDEIVGTYTIDPASKILKVVFNDKLENKSSRKGEVWANLKFNESKLNEDANQTISFGEKINKTFEVTAVPGGDTKLISKSGSPNKNKNADYVNWVIDVNTKLEKLTNGSVEDTIPEGLGVPYDFEIIDLKVGFNGSVSENGASSITATEFPVSLGATNSAYRIKYKTKILDHSKAAYNNVATLKDGDIEKDTGEFDIGELKIGSTIDKKGKANKGGTNSDKITWTIDVNKAQLALDNVSIGDEFTEKSGHTLDITDIRIFKIDEHGAVQGGNIAGDYSNPTTFPVDLGNLANQAIRIEYDTEIIYNEYKHTDNIFKNKATLNVNETPKGDPVEGTVTVRRESLIEKVGVEGTSYGQPFIDWVLHINKAKHTINEATVTDIIGNGLKLVDDVKVYVGNTTTEYDSGKYSVTDKTDNKFKVNFTEASISDYYTIKYRTDIIDPGATLTNEAELFGDGLKGDGIGLGIIKVGETGPTNVVNNSYTKSKVSSGSVDGVTYDGVNHIDKTMSWKISVNAIKEQVTELTITDTFTPDKSMVFLEETLKVKKGSDILTRNADYILTDNKAGGFVLKFTGAHKPLERAQYDIYYKTSFDTNTVLAEGGTLNAGRNYANTASFVGKTKDVTNTEKPLAETDSDNNNINQVVSNGGKKDGVLDRANRKIDWKVYANALGQDLTGAPFVITDTIGQSISAIGDGKSGQVFDKNSIVLREYSLSKTGTIIEGDTINSDNYTVGYDSDDKLIVTFASGVSTPVMLEYTTDIKGISQAKYDNSAKITGKDGLEKTYPKYVTYSNHNAFISKAAISATDGKVYTDDEIEWELEINKSLSDINAGAVITDQLSNGLVYLNDSLDIKKSNGDSLVKDTDYTFTIANNKLTITFTNPVTEIYTVTYKTAVTAGKGVKIKNEASFKGESDSVTDSGDKNYTVQQFSGGTGSGVYRGSIKIVKTDADDSSKLKDAEFEVYYLLNGTEKQIVKNAAGDDTHKTNANGEILIKGLPLREYHIREVAAPNGYVMNYVDVTKKTLTSVPAEKDITLSFTNTKTGNAKGSIKFIKKDEDGNKLQGAEFKLYKSSDQTTALETVTSDENGVIKFSEQVVGDYVIKETSAPEGYVPSEDIPVKLKVTTNGQVFEIDDVENKTIRGNIELEKEDTAGNKLPGATFRLYDGENTVTDSTSDSEGKVKFENIPYGEYTIKEIKAPTGYKASEDVITVKIEENGVVATPSQGTVKNEKIIGDVQVIKLDEDGVTPLPGAVFVLKQGDDVKYTSDPTDNTGSYVFDGVNYGEYILEELTPPTGYKLTNEKVTVNIVEKDQDIIVVEIKNDIMRGNIKLKKVGEDGEGLENAVFSIYKSTDTEFKYPVTTATSNADGEAIFTGVAYGEYKIKETTAPEGYNLSDKVLDAKITTQDEVIDLTTDPVSNTKIRGNIEILKRNRNTHNPLAGAKIAIYTKDDVLIGEKETPADGKVKFEDLEYGEYYYKETKAPSGYILDSLKYPFEIKENNVTIERNLDNRRRPVYPVDPPIDPEEPDNPDPEEPRDPEDPDNPDPEKPTDPDKPGEPDPEKPTDPDKPGKPDPEKPTDPDKPGDPEPEEPTDPEKPNEPDTPGKTPEEPIKENTPKDTPKEGETPPVPEGGTVKPTTPPKNGTITVDPNGKWTYTPNPGYVGKDRFVITITHPDGTTEDIYIEIDVGETPLGTIDPEEADKPSKPGKNPEEADKPSKPGKNPEEATDGAADRPVSGQGKLPKTGETSKIGFYAVGLLLIALGIFLNKKRKTA